MRIGYLVQQFPPEVGAGPARVAEMATRWTAAGHEVTVITAMPNRPQGRIYPGYRRQLFRRDEWQGIEVLRSWLYARPDGGFVTTILNNLSFMTTGAAHGAVRARGLDVLIASSPPFFVHAAGVVQSALQRVPLVLELRDLWPDYLVEMGRARSPIARRALFGLERALLRRADEVVVVTESFRRRVEAKGVDRHRIHLVPNGVDLALYGAPADGVDGDGAASAERDFVVGYLGNFGAGQDLSVVIEAAEIVAREDPSVRFRLVGDGPERGKLEREADRGRGRVAIEPPIAKHETPGFYAECDACLVPLAAIPVFQETVPSKLFEILATGRPVLGSFAGEGAAILEASGGGVVCPPGDARAIARGVLQLRGLSAGQRRQIGERGRAYVGAHYSREDLAVRYLDVLTAAARRGRTRGGRT